MNRVYHYIDNEEGVPLADIALIPPEGTSGITMADSILEETADIIVKRAKLIGCSIRDDFSFQVMEDDKILWMENGGYNNFTSSRWEEPSRLLINEPLEAAVILYGLVALIIPAWLVIQVLAKMFQAS